jgi:hypothetical protein
MGALFIQIVVWVCTRAWVLVYPSELSLFNPHSQWNYKPWLDLTFQEQSGEVLKVNIFVHPNTTNIGLAEFFSQKNFILVPMPAHLAKVTWQQNLVMLPSDPFFLLYLRGFSLIAIMAWQKCTEFGKIDMLAWKLPLRLGNFKFRG